jgi:hypothetical protein
MAKETAKSKEVAKYTSTAEIQTVIQSTNEIDLLEGLRSMSEMPEENFTDVTGSYWKPVEGMVYDVVVVGVSVQKFPDRARQGEVVERECVHFCTEEKGKLVNYIYAGAQFVSTIAQEIAKDRSKGLTPQAMGFRIFKTGELKSAKGNYSNFVIKRMYAQLEATAGN